MHVTNRARRVIVSNFEYNFLCFALQFFFQSGVFTSRLGGTATPAHIATSKRIRNASILHVPRSILGMPKIISRGYVLTTRCSRGSRTRQAEEKTPFDTIANKTRNHADAPISQVALPSPPWEIYATMTSESPLQQPKSRATQIHG